MQASNMQSGCLFSRHTLAVLLALSQLICLADSLGNTYNDRDLTINKSSKGPDYPAEGYNDTQMSQKDQNLIVQEHNRCRSQLASGRLYSQRRESGTYFPAAKNMQQMKWSDDVARTAMIHARQCIDDNNEVECRPHDGQLTGQNFAYVWTSDNTTTPDWQGVMNAWWNEHKDYNAEKIAHVDLSNPYRLHFTQMVWAETNLIGCVFVAYSKTEIIQKQRYKGVARFYVCNYAPRGNILEMPLYQEGKRDSCRPNDGYLPSCQDSAHGSPSESSCTWCIAEVAVPVITLTLIGLILCIVFRCIG